MTVSIIRKLGSLAVVAGLTLVAGRADAQTWTAAASGTWSTGANWVGGSPPVSGAATTLTFGDPTVAGLSYTATNDIGTTPFLLNSLVFNGNAGSLVTVAGLDPINNGLSFVANGAVSPTIVVGAGNATITSAVTLGAATTISGGAGTLTFNNAISGAGVNLTDASTGPLVLAGGASLNQLTLQAGSVTVTGGAVAAMNVINIAQTGGSTGAVTVTGFKSTLTVLGTSSIGGVAGTPGGAGSITGNAGSTVTLTGPVILYGSATLTANTGLFGTFSVGGLDDGVTGSSVGAVAVSSGSTLTINTNGVNASFSGVISGAGGVTKTGPGTQTFTGGVNSFSGPIGLNGGVVNFGNINDLGTGTAINFNGGTLQFAGTNTADISARAVTINARGATIDTGANTVTFANAIGNGNGALTKLGTGTLILAPAPAGGPTGFNTFLGGVNVQNGTLSVASDLALGVLNNGTVAAPVFLDGGDVTGAPSGTLNFTGTTQAARSFAMNGGTISVVAGATVTFVGSQVSGATLAGAGTFATNATNGAQFVGVTSKPSVVITSASANDQFVNFTNGANASSATQTGLTVAPGVNTAGTSTVTNFNGFTNQGSGSVTIGAASVVNVSNFQSYGVLTLNPAVVGSSQFTEIVNTGTSPLFFNGGSRTFLGTPATAGPPSAPNFVAGIDLHGQNAEVAGGLFVNNGFVVDSTNSGTGTATIVADFGALVKGAGFFQNTIITQNGGKVQAGNSPGSISFGQFVFGPGGVSNYVFAIDDATGTAGPSPNAAGLVSGWGLINAIHHSSGASTTSGSFTWTATPTSKLTVAIDTLVNPTTVGTDVPGLMADFNPNAAYSWPAAQWAGTYSGPTDVAALNAATSFDTSGFVNPIAGTFGWSLNTSSQTLSLTYTPSAVPEPGTLAFTALAGLGLARSIRRRHLAKAAGAV
jgi:fibronectin-binding autotransporter adhesin